MSMLRTILAVLCVVAALVIGLPLMLMSESYTDTNITSNLGPIYDMSNAAIQQLPAIKTMVNNGLKPYFLGFGLTLFLCAVAFILVDGKDKLVILQGSDSDTPA